MSSDHSQEASGSASVAQSLRQATQLLLRAVEHLDSTPGTIPRPTPAPTNARIPSGSGLRQTATESSTSSVRNSLFRPSYLRGRDRRRHRPYDTAAKRWHHSFVCLAKVGQYLPPDTADRVRLVQAGLGEKRITCGVDSGPEDLHQELLAGFPRLKNGGGYEYLKLDECGRKTLTVVPPPIGGYTPFYLKSIFHQAKVYMRPLQRCLDLTPADDVSILIGSYISIAA